jgi:deazaflavin-dependent oxidoreductase (nitroreductase family)
LRENDNLILVEVNEAEPEVKRPTPSTSLRAGSVTKSATRVVQPRKEGMHMTARNDTLKGRLSKASEITITVTGRKSGRSISIPVWFVVEDDQLYLLPVQGSDTQWYQNVLKNPKIRVDAGGAQAELQVRPTTDPKEVLSIVEKFRKKYGANDVRKYYSKIDVAVVAKIQ